MKIELRPLLVALGLTLAAAATLAVGGFRDDRPVTVVASLSPTSVPTTRPTLEPSMPTPTASAPQAPDVYTIDDWGITLTRDVTTPWRAVEVGFNGNRVGIDRVGDPTRSLLMSPDGQTSRDLFFGTCSAEGCGRPLISLSLAQRKAGLVVGTTDCWHAPDNVVFDCFGRGNDLWPVTISGPTLAQLQEDWLATFGDATVTQISLDGEPAIALDRGGLTTVLAVHGKVLVAVITQPLVGREAEAGARALEAVIENFRFDDSRAASSDSPR